MAMYQLYGAEYQELIETFTMVMRKGIPINNIPLRVWVCQKNTMKDLTKRVKDMRKTIRVINPPTKKWGVSIAVPITKRSKSFPLSYIKE